MNDLDMLYDYYTFVNLAAGGYATISSRIKDDKIEKLMRKMARYAMADSRSSAEMLIKFGGRIY